MKLGVPRLRDTLRKVSQWIEERAGIGAVVQPILAHRVPRSTASWWYVFGSATLALFMLQIATGICLALVYVPSADEAYQSLQYLNYQAPFGWYLRAMHFWGSNAMVAVMTLHMIQVFLFGAHKYPREMTWVVGCLLFLCTLGMAFTGQVLRWDQDAYWGLGISASIAARSPVIGDQLVHVLLGGPIIAGRTLSRFFAVHVFAIPGLLFALIGLHLWLVLKIGINEWPMPGRLVNRETYRQQYEEEVQKDGVAFFPHAARKDMVGMGVIVLIVMICAAVFGPHGPRGFPDPTLIDTAPAPDFYFLALFSLFALLPPYTESVLMLLGPPIAIGLLFVIPFIAGTGEKSWKRRPVAVLGVILIVLIVTTLAGARPRRAVVAAHGRVERGADAGCVREGPHAARAAGRAGDPEQAVPRPATAWTAAAASAGRRSTAWRRGSRGISSSARFCRGAGTCRRTARTSRPPRSMRSWPSSRRCAPEARCPRAPL